jgi:hypothetical protein
VTRRAPISPTVVGPVASSRLTLLMAMAFIGTRKAPMPMKVSAAGRTRL